MKTTEYHYRIYKKKKHWRCLVFINFHRSFLFLASQKTVQIWTILQSVFKRRPHLLKENYPGTHQNLNENLHIAIFVSISKGENTTTQLSDITRPSATCATRSQASLSRSNDGKWRWLNNSEGKVISRTMARVIHHVHAQTTDPRNESTKLAAHLSGGLKNTRVRVRKRQFS